MGVLLLKLSGPLQSWGAESRFLERKTRHEPTKSGVIGLLAAALGRRREDSVEDLASLAFAVRVDQAGSYERDYQTAHTRKFDQKSQSWVSGESLPLSNRYYLADAVFVAALKVPGSLMESYADALLHPAFPLYLGRRSCPPSERILLDSCDEDDLMGALAGHEWLATQREVIRSHAADEFVELMVYRDKLSTDEQAAVYEVVQDAPVSFSQEHRRYALRTVIHDHVLVANPYFEKRKEGASSAHDPMALLEEVQ